MFTCLIEGTLTASPTRGHTRSGAVWVQFPIVVKERYRDQSGKWVDATAMHFDIVCWRDLADRVDDLVRGDRVVVQAGRLLPYVDDGDQPALKVHAQNVSLSMRFTPAHTGPKTRQRSGDVVVTADGERIAAEAYPERVADRELVHH
jgi:single-stranded DNA-binding protein